MCSKEFDKASEKRISFVRNLPPSSKIHLSGVCGTGMAAVLSLLKQLGFRCTGSDKAFYPPMGDVVRGLADQLFEGYHAENISSDTDLVVIGNALSRGNSEVEHVLEQKIPFASMPEVLSALLIGTREQCATSIVVCGTHGKTTTTALIAHVLEVAGLNPGYFIGGLASDFASTVRPLDSDLSVEKRVVVLEGDEYDSAFFAKYAKFHCYRPDIAIITSLEFDHADIYNSIEEIEQEFTHLVERMPQDGLILVCGESERLGQLAKEWKDGGNVEALVEFYGSGPDVYAELISREPGVVSNGQRLKLKIDGQLSSVSSPLTGEHNALNVLSACAVASRLKLNFEKLADAISSFSGVVRRQQIILEQDGYLLMEDFAHHPTAVQKTLEGLREAYPERRLIAVFEPRSNTSRRSFFQKEYTEAFGSCDLAVLLNVSNAGSYSATSGEIEPLDVKCIVEELVASGTDARSFSSVDEIQSFIVDNIQAKDLVVLMSNGDFGGLPGTLVEKLS